MGNPDWSDRDDRAEEAHNAGIDRRNDNESKMLKTIAELRNKTKPSQENTSQERKETQESDK
jgi:hypothetical protein